VTFADFDTRGLPKSERVGAWPAGSVLARHYDAFGNTVATLLPQGIAASAGFAGFRASFDALDRMTSVTQATPDGAPIPGAAFAATLSWSGSTRPLGVTTPGGLGTAQGFDPGSGRLARLSMSANGTMLGQMAYTWDVARDLKLGRVVRSEGGLASSFGYTAQYDAVQRMTGASTGRGSTEGGSQGVVLGRWGYAYGQADELVSITEATGGVWQYASGAEGRITRRSGPDGSEAFAYDGEGRRIEDASSRSTWDWRGRLVQVDIKDVGAGLVPALAPHAGERIVYAYDATGRLLSRTHLGQIPPGGSDSDRPFLAKRAFVWDGQRLAAEAGLNFQDQPLWRQQYAPGQRGLDDAPLVRVEKDLQATPSTETYAILRDEMGTPLAVVEEAQGPGSGGGLRLLTRYLSAPYGQRHSELGPELVAIAFDATITKVGSTDQRPTAKQTVSGALRVVTTSPLASASLASGLVLEQWDQAAGSWRTAPRTDFAIGTADDDPTDLRVMRLAGWAKATRYRITLLPSITDTFGRGLILPEGERQGVVVELAVPEDGTTPPSYARVFPLAYDKSASDTLAGAFPGGQTFGFQGAWTDPATGLAYHRARWYDPRNATWLSADPLGAVNSLNLFAFVGHRPLMATDATGRYEADVHAGMTYYLALQAGFDQSEAAEVAFWAEWPDVAPSAEPVHNAAIGNWEPIYEYHFPIDPKTGRVEPANATAMRGVRQARSLRQLGMAIHTLQDSFGHSPSYPGNITGQAKSIPGARLLLKRAEAKGKVSRPEQGITHTILNPRSFWLSPVAAMHAADYTCLRPELAFSMEQEVFRAMVDYLAREGRLSPSESYARTAAFVRFSPMVRDFNVAWTKQQKMRWLETNCGRRAVGLVPWADVTLPFCAPPPSSEDLRRLLLTPANPPALLPVPAR